MNKLQVVQFWRRPPAGAFSIERVFTELNEAMPAQVSVRKVVSIEQSRGLWPRLRAGLHAWRNRGQVNHVVGDVHFLTLFLPRGSCVLTIHDCEMILRASGLKRYLLWLFWLRLPVARAAIVVAISEKTAQDIRDLLGNQNQQVEVIGNPKPTSFSHFPAASDHGQPVVLQIGTKENKNLERLVAAMSGINARLVVIGRLTQSQCTLLSESGLTYETRFNLSEQEILEAYRQATVVAFVSLSEGFGLPIIEAQAAGRAVLCSDREPMRSVAGDGALFVDPSSKSAIREGLDVLLRNVRLREQFIEKGHKNVSRFAADTLAARYAAIYADLAGSSKD